MGVTQNLYRLGSAEPTNNLPTSARHPVQDDEIVGAAWRHAEGVDKEPADNNPVRDETAQMERLRGLVGPGDSRMAMD